MEKVEVPTAAKGCAELLNLSQYECCNTIYTCYIRYLKLISDAAISERHIARGVHGDRIIPKEQLKYACKDQCPFTCG